jgi:WD40 repeat protein
MLRLNYLWVAVQGKGSGSILELIMPKWKDRYLEFIWNYQSSFLVPAIFKKSTEYIESIDFLNHGFIGCNFYIILTSNGIILLKPEKKLIYSITKPKHHISKYKGYFLTFSQLFLNYLCVHLLKSFIPRIQQPWYRLGCCRSFRIWKCYAMRPIPMVRCDENLKILWKINIRGKIISIISNSVSEFSIIFPSPDLSLQ